jgi:hypothetical protein
MKTIYIRGGNKEEPGVLVLKEHLENKGHRVVRAKNQDYDVVVCYGCSMRDPLVRKVPALNGHVNLYNKYQALERFRKNDVRTPEFFSVHTWMYDGYDCPFPWFARKYAHERGRDIRICQTRNDVKEVYGSGSHDFFSVYVPHDEELRAWVWNDEVFAIYHKQYRNPSLENYKTMEFRSELRDDLLRTRTLTGGAIDAVKALKMDFGAVDILHGLDGKYYVLEVNSMPDISSTIRVSGIRLADKIHRWAEAQ